MSKITLSFMERFMNNLDTAIRNFVASKDTTQQGTAISTNTNLDTFKTEGNYYIPSDTIASSLNLPIALCGKFLVLNNGNGGYAQFYIPNHSPRLFQRLWWSSAWTDWKEYGEGGGSSTTRLTEVLSAGSTSVTFNSDKITTTALYDIYTSTGINYTGVTEGTNTITVAFEAQESNVTVILEIKE